MASDREERVRTAFAAFATRDLPALIELLDPEVELRPLVSVWERNYRGHEGAERWFDEVARTWASFAFEADEVRDLDPDRVLVKATWRGTAVEGGSEVGGPSAAIVTFRDDKVLVADFFLSEEAALQSLETADG